MTLVTVRWTGNIPLVTRSPTTPTLFGARLCRGVSILYISMTCKQFGSWSLCLLKLAPSICVFTECLFIKTVCSVCSSSVCSPGILVHPVSLSVSVRVFTQCFCVFTQWLCLQCLCVHSVSVSTVFLCPQCFCVHSVSAFTVSVFTVSLRSQCLRSQCHCVHSVCISKTFRIRDLEAVIHHVAGESSQRSFPLSTHPEFVTFPTPSLHKEGVSLVDMIGFSKRLPSDESSPGQGWRLPRCRV